MTERAKRGKAKTGGEAPRANGVRSVAEMVPQVGAMAFKRFGFVQSSIVSRWAEIVGERYAEVSTPESIRFPAAKKQEGVLSLVVHGSHAPMMQHVVPAILERVNRFFGYPAVARIVIRQGAAAPRPEPRRAPPSLKPVPAELGDSLRAIADPELRDCLAALAGAVAASAGPPRLAPTRRDRSDD
jgi:hypothetical protein